MSKHVQCGSALAVCCIHLCSMQDQKRSEFSIASLDCVVEWTATLDIDRIHQRAVRAEMLHSCDWPILRRDMQRRLSSTGLFEGGEEMVDTFIECITLGKRVSKLVHAFKERETRKGERHS